MIYNLELDKIPIIEPKQANNFEVYVSHDFEVHTIFQLSPFQSFETADVSTSMDPCPCHVVRCRQQI